MRKVLIIPYQDGSQRKLLLWMKKSLFFFCFRAFFLILNPKLALAVNFKKKITKVYIVTNSHYPMKSKKIFNYLKFSINDFYVIRSSTPKNVVHHRELIKVSNKKCSRKGNSYQDIELATESDETEEDEEYEKVEVDDTADSEDDRPLSNVVSNGYVKARNKLLKVESQYEKLQFKYKEQEMLNKTKTSVLEEQLSDRLQNIESLTK